jgi:AcrR family transcriptional regulator
VRNAEATRERILEAATAEFSAHGVAGARVDRVAAAAGCNKNLIYVYFGSKETLFNAVLNKHLARVYDENPFTPDDLPGYAVRVFDYASAHPDLFRLVAWSTLERVGGGSAEKGAAQKAKIASLKQAQQAGQVSAALPPAFLLTAIMSIATAWSAANPFGSTIDPDAPKRPAALRRCIAEAVRALTRTERDDG